MSSSSICIASVAKLHGDLSQEDALARLILGDGQGWWTGVQISYNRETYLWSVYIMESLFEMP
jgi:hypothetical protein